MSLSRRAFIVLGTASLLSACASATAPPGRTTPAELSQGRIVAAINATRGSAGRKPLAYNRTLEEAARIHATLMASRNTLSHTIGGSLRERVTAVGYVGAVGENLGAGQVSLEAVIDAWLKSSGHRSTLLSPNFSEFGLAAARSSGGKIYWAYITGGDFSAWK